MKISSYLPTKKALVQNLVIMVVGAVLAVVIVKHSQTVRSFFDKDQTP